MVLQPRGLIITNNHVAGAKGRRVTIVTGDNREVPADVVFSDPQRDLDVLNPKGLWARARRWPVSRTVRCVLATPCSPSAARLAL